MREKVVVFKLGNQIFRESIKADLRLQAIRAVKKKYPNAVIINVS